MLPSSSHGGGLSIVDRIFYLVLAVEQAKVAGAGAVIRAELRQRLPR